MPIGPRADAGANTHECGGDSGDPTGCAEARQVSFPPAPGVRRLGSPFELRTWNPSSRSRGSPGEIRSSILGDVVTTVRPETESCIRIAESFQISAAAFSRS